MIRNRFLALLVLFLVPAAASAMQIGQTIEVRADDSTTTIRCTVNTIDADTLFLGLTCPYGITETAPSGAPVPPVAGAWTVFAAFLDPAILVREWTACRVGSLAVIDCRTPVVVFADGFGRS